MLSKYIYKQTLFIDGNIVSIQIRSLLVNDSAKILWKFYITFTQLYIIRVSKTSSDISIMNNIFKMNLKSPAYVNNYANW